jgi:hypothetical protein
VQSSLISYFSDSGPFNKINQRVIRRKFLKVAYEVFEETTDLMESEPEVTHIYVPNGRYADQNAFFIAAKIKNPRVITYYYEKGFTEGKYYIGQHSLHDRKKAQEVLKLQDFDRNRQEAINWFDQRKTNWVRNEFIFNWEGEEGPRTKSYSTKKTAVLFNSSNDEFASLGLDWNDSDWDSQWDAFEKISYYLKEKGYEIALRLHPNGINKSRREKGRERRKLQGYKAKFPDIQIYGPDSKVSSYTLINSSSLVIVWNSTVGLEACYMGRPVVNLNASEWDEFIPILSVKSESALSYLETKLKDPSRNDCVNFISARMALDKDLKNFKYSVQYSHKEHFDFIYRLAKAFSGSRPFDLRNILKSFFAKTNSRPYQIMKKINFKIKAFGG